MKNPNTKIFAQNGNHGLDIYLDISGQKHYLATRRKNGLLYLWLKDGKTIGEINRVKPSYSRAAQKTHHYAQSIAKLAEDYITFDLAS